MYSKMIEPEKSESGSGGFAWENVLPDQVFSQIRPHVYFAHEMHAGLEWAGDQFCNHYNRLYYLVSGRAELNFKDQSIVMEPGHMYLIPPYELISHRAIEPIHFFWLHFQTILGLDDEFFMLYGKTLELKIEKPEESETRLKQLCLSMHDKRPSTQLLRNADLLKLLAPFIECLQGLKLKTENKSNNDKLLPALKNLSANLARPLVIQELATQAGMSAAHFSRSFKQRFKLSPKRYLQLKRIEHAKQLLLTNTDNMAEIAEQCGFCDQFHFSKTFKVECGLSPLAFRQRYRIQA